jgi:hypothetical protein
MHLQGRAAAPIGQDGVAPEPPSDRTRHAGVTEGVGGARENPLRHGRRTGRRAPTRRL